MVEPEGPSVLRQPWAVAAAALVLLIYVAVLRTMPKGAFWSPDEGAKYIQLHSIKWEGGLRYAIAYGGQRLDPGFAFYPAQCRFNDLYPAPLDDGGVKFHWPIWFPLGSQLAVAAFGLTGLYVIPLLSGWLVALAAGWLSCAWNPRLAPLAIIGAGLATPIAFFSLTFWEHTLACALGLAALVIVAAAWPRRTLAPILATPLLFAAAALRIELLAFGAAVLGAWLAARRLPLADGSLPVVSRMTRGRLAVVVCAVVVLGWLFSDAMPARHRWMVQVLPNSVLDSFAKLPHAGEMLTALLVDQPGNQAPVVADPWRYAVLLTCLGGVAAPWLRSQRAAVVLLLVALAAVFEFSFYLIIRPQPYISLHGFVPIAPFTILAAYALPAAWRRPHYRQRVVAGTAVLYVLFALAVMFVFLLGPDGLVPTGLEWGNRYLLTLYPIATVLALAGVDELRRSQGSALFKRVVTAAAVALFACGVLLQARGVWMLVESRRLVTTWQAALRDGPPVVTDVWWLPAAMAPLFVDQAVHCVSPPTKLGTFLPVARAHGVDTVTFVSFHPLDLHGIEASGLAATADGEQVISGLRLTRIRIAPASAPAAAAAAP